LDWDAKDGSCDHKRHREMQDAPGRPRFFCCFDLMDGRSLEIAVCRMFLGWIHLFVPSREYVPAVAYDGWAVIV
jgi:hypothetical protein